MASMLDHPEAPDASQRRERAAIAAQACQTCRNRCAFLRVGAGTAIAHHAVADGDSQEIQVRRTAAEM